jgi:H/ACA ribonucleoprotein complex subunit 4
MYSRFGTHPAHRTVEELLNFGIINLDKPRGPSSHQVTAWVKQILEIKKAGHGGTLDPKVTGVLPIVLNNATKVVDIIRLFPKEYVCVMRLHRDLDTKKVLDMFDEFSTTIYQTPPVRAAVKRRVRIKKIYDLDVLEIDNQRVLFRVECEAGTYIRTLCHDIGEALGVGGHMEDLRRIKTGNFHENRTFTLHDVKDAYTYWKENDDEKEIRRIIQPVEKLLENLPKVVIKDSAVDAICHGADLSVRGIIEIYGEITPNKTIAIFTSKGESVAIGKSLFERDHILKSDRGVVIDVKTVLMSRGTYPPLWRRKSKMTTKKGSCMQKKL